MTEMRHDWTLDEVVKLYEQPFNDLLFQAHTVHRDNFDPNAVQMSTLLSIKTGGCPEDCAYCPQSVHYDTGVDAHPLLPVDDVVAAAKRAKEGGATRFCMGAAWRKPTNRQVDQVAELIEAVRDEGMDTCVTLGMLTEPQAQKLKSAGLDYYNHNLDTSPDLYNNIITTRTYEDRLETLQHVRDAGMNVCCGGIVGMGEDNRGRMGLLIELANLPEHPESVPINMLVQVEGTPMHGTEELDIFEFIRTVAVARILMPQSFVRLSAGRTDMTSEAQALCFFAGANSVFSGDKLLTTPNPEVDEDQLQLQKLGIRTYTSAEEAAPEVNRAVSG
ncbi:MAG: biotin synthase BioB [Gammaproteobacteria bacterium]|nr:biotin synthase BioB [Gammaproteobacteria bacterium]RPG25683.1 MAG: biotin synthase BioB [Gammaproteobacteria bacterium TMED50]|tara:strand:- start:15650 stop:16642 length:993 start_codon:yes stop_codon:yes gene_type:complete